MSKDIARLAEEARREAHDQVGLLLAAFKQGNTDPMETIALHTAIDRAIRLAALAARVEQAEKMHAQRCSCHGGSFGGHPFGPMVGCKYVMIDGMVHCDGGTDPRCNAERNRLLAEAGERCDSCGSTDPKTRYVVVVQTGLDERDTRCENDEFHGKETI